MTDPINVSDDSKLSIPLRNLLSILGAVAVSTWAYSGVIERLNKIETKQAIDEEHIAQNSEFRIMWPRGEMGSLPADARQDMMIESFERELNDLREDIESNTKWIAGFEPPQEVKDTMVRVRELELKIQLLLADRNK